MCIWEKKIVSDRCQLDKMITALYTHSLLMQSYDQSSQLLRQIFTTYRSRLTTTTNESICDNDNTYIPLGIIASMQYPRGWHNRVYLRLCVHVCIIECMQYSNIHTWINTLLHTWPCKGYPPYSAHRHVATVAAALWMDLWFLDNYWQWKTHCIIMDNCFFLLQTIATTISRRSTIPRYLRIKCLCLEFLKNLY